MKKTKTVIEPKAIQFGDPQDMKGDLQHLGGSRSDDWNNILAISVLRSLWVAQTDAAARERQYAATVYALAGIAPRDELEGMLAGQLLATHYATMECYRRAMLENQTLEGRRENLNQANKLSRTHAMLLEALNRHRGKGQQKVTVEHVHVHEGGQAIVGNVTHPGGGVAAETEDQPHALGHAPRPAMPGDIETERQALPVPGRKG